MNSSNHASDQLLTLAEAEAITKRKVSTWRRDIAKRRITYVRIGRSIRIPRSVIEELIASGRRAAVEVAR
jgi:excisionase family DNA binding protein